MTDAKLVGEGAKYYHFRVESKTVKEAVLEYGQWVEKPRWHDVRIDKATLEASCACKQGPFRERKPGPRECNGKTIVVGAPGRCHHIKAADRLLQEHLLERTKILKTPNIANGGVLMLAPQHDKPEHHDHKDTGAL
jgi:hypothetical protein